MPKAIFFDLGGVVFTDFFSGGAEEFSGHLGVTPDKIREVYVKTDVPGYPKGHINDTQRWQAFIDELKLPQYMLQKCIDYYYESYRPIRETVELLHGLKNSGHYKLGTLSDQPPGVMGHLYRTYADIFAIFDSSLVIISVETGLSKKDRDHEIYSYATKRTGNIAKDILFIDDSLSNINIAKSFGLDTYFFDRHSKPITDLTSDLRALLL